MLKNHLKKAIAAAMIFVMVFALTAPALAEENSELKAAEDAVREAEENYNIAVEQYNNAMNMDAGSLNAKKAELEQLRGDVQGKIYELTTRIAVWDESIEEGRDGIEQQLEEERKKMNLLNKQISEIDEKLDVDALMEEMYRCELLLDIARYDLERLQQALIIPQTGDSNAVYLAAGVMLILAGAGLAVSRKRS